MSLKFKFAVPVLATILGAAAIPAMAQNNGGGGGNGGGNNNGGGGGGGGGGRGNWNPAQFQQMRLDRIKQQLGATDDEFTALQPKLEAVMTAQTNAGGGFGRGFGGRGRGGGGGGGGQPQAPTTPVGTALTELQTTLDDKDAKPEDIKSKLDAVREAKKTAKETLVKAQEDLKSVLTQRQEAVLVENNLLD